MMHNFSLSIYNQPTILLDAQNEHIHTYSVVSAFLFFLSRLILLFQRIEVRQWEKI